MIIVLDTQKIDRQNPCPCCVLFVLQNIKMMRWTCAKTMEVHFANVYRFFLPLQALLILYNICIWTAYVFILLVWEYPVLLCMYMLLCVTWKCILNFSICRMFRLKASAGRLVLYIMNISASRTHYFVL